MTPPTDQSSREQEREAFVQWLGGSYPLAYDKEKAEHYWEHGHVSALAWQQRACLAEQRTRAMRDALQEIANVLGAGPCDDNTCQGCRFEHREAANIARAALSTLPPTAITAEEAGREGIDAEFKEGAAEEILRTYLALHKGKLGAHWMWCAIEQLVAGIPEAEVMSDYGYFSTPPSALLVDKSANLQGSSVDRSTEMQGPSAPGNGEVLVRYCPGCGSVGPVEAKYRDCCPDGNEARMIPEALANKCHDTFRLAIKGAYADAAMLPPAPAQSEGQG